MILYGDDPDAMVLAFLLDIKTREEKEGRRRPHGTERFGGENLSEVDLDSFLHFLACGCGLPVGRRKV
jgi:hypothetical protein